MADEDWEADIFDESFHHGYLSAIDAEQLLRKEGDFLVRSEHPCIEEYVHVISVLWASDFHHIKIRQTSKGTCYADKGKYELDSLQKLISFHRKRQVPLTPSCPAKLTRAMKRANWELLNENIQIGKKLSEGGMFGAVHRAKQILNPVDTVLVAAKLFDLHLLDSGRTQRYKKIMQQARLMRLFDHHNVVKLRGIAVMDLPFIFVMEFVSHGSLDSFLQKRANKIGNLDRLSFSVDAARGLTHIHSKGIVHRDVGTRNCLLSEDYKVKISGFGRSQLMLKEASQDSTKVPVRWSAPEVFRGWFTPKSDVYSFSILMWEIYSNGGLPYEGKAAVAVQQEVSAGKRLESPPVMPTKVRNLMKHCWEHKGDDRPKMEEVSNKLLELMKAYLTKTDKKEAGLMTLKHLKDTFDPL